jgi:hypothetical protein
MTTLADAAYKHLKPSGEESFEHLVANQLSVLTGITFRLAKSGTQFGIDAQTRNVTTIALQCKRYGDGTSLQGSRLKAELLESSNHAALDAWILATTQTLGANDETTLSKMALKLGLDFVVIDVSGPAPTDLDILLASDHSVLAEHFGHLSEETVDAISNQAALVRSCSSYDERIKRLRERLADANVGYDNWRRRTHERLRGGFESRLTSSRVFHQPLNVVESDATIVKRSGVHEAISLWWTAQQVTLTNTPRPFLVIDGEEGDGKTWALATWMASEIESRQSEFPAIVWLSAKEVSEGEIERCIAQFLQRAYGTDLPKAMKQVSRWLSPGNTTSPACVLVIDGLNENPNTAMWRKLFAEYMDKSSRLGLSLIVTVRTGYWKHNIPSYSQSNKVISVGSYSDIEYAEALEKAGLRAKNFPADVDDLVKKPRYFGLAVQFWEEIKQSGGVITRARLIYEDMRARYKSNSQHPISHEAFQEYLVSLAKKHKDSCGRFSTREISDVPMIGDHEAAVMELITGGVFKRVGTSYEFHDNHLPHALGLLVGEELCAAQESVVPDEVIARWIEPQAAIDLKAKILEFAFIYSIQRQPPATPERQSALLHAWLHHQNRLSEYGDNLGSYLTVAPAAYVLFTERLVCKGQLYSEVERSLLKAFVNGLNYMHVREHLEKAIDYWCSLVCAAGDWREGDEKEEVRAA